ncbi:MAG: RNA-binding protein [Kineosporiaceae bacterium]
MTTGGPVIADAVEHLVRGIVTHPDDVRVDVRPSRRGTTIRVRVHAEDVGKVIGRTGRTATALRTVVNALAGDGGVRVDIVGPDER